MEISTTSTSETEKLAIKIAEGLKGGETLALYGDLGSGKTTFTRYLVKALGIDARVQSPTFVVMRTYVSTAQTEIKKVNHIDLYRFQSEEEIEVLDLEDVLSQKDEISIIEWPELAEKYFSESVIKIYFEDLGENNRKIRIENINA